MALTLYDTLFDSNSNEYTFDPPSDYQNIWYNSNWVNGHYQDLPGTMMAYVGHSTSPFSQSFADGVTPWTGDVVFSYSGNTIKITFDASGIVYLYLNDTSKGYLPLKSANLNINFISCWFVKNENNLIGFQGKYVGGYDSSYSYGYLEWCGIILSQADSEIFDDVLSHALPVTYNWQSVPSVSGKNGILSLAQIKDDYINDGESVSGVSADHFTNLSTENRVDVLINDALPDPETGGTTVTVKYTIPSLSIGTYEYCKLVAKKNSIPESVEDGDKIINIDPTDASVSVKNLNGHTKYYFIIFVKDSNDLEASSEPKSITTQGAVIPEEYQQYLDLLALTSWGTNSDTTLLTYLNRRGNSSTSVVSSDHSFATRDNFNNNSNCYAFSVLQMSTINISTDPVTVLYTCNVAEYDIIKTSGRDMWGVYSENGNGGDYITLWGSASGISSPGNTDGLRFNPTTSFNSLEDCLIYLTQHFRHVNIKVDGEYWLKLD